MFSRENKVQTFFFQGPLAKWAYCWWFRNPARKPPGMFLFQPQQTMGEKTTGPSTGFLAGLKRHLSSSKWWSDHHHLYVGGVPQPDP